MYDRILVPTDGSEGASVAARYGETLASRFDSDLHFLSIVDDQSYGYVFDALDDGGAEQRNQFEQQARNAVQRLADGVGSASIDCHTAVEYGTPAAGIDAYATEHDIDVIAMGTHGRTGIERFLLGSVTERVLRDTDIPVLTCRGDAQPRNGFEAVLVPTDGSPAAAAAVEHAVAIADRFDATVHGISVVDIVGLAGASDVGPVVPDVIDAFEAECRSALDTVETACENAGVTVETGLIEGSPSQVIRSYVTDNDIDLVTMGTHGRSGIDRVLMGSVAERTIRTSPVPVLTTH